MSLLYNYFKSYQLLNDNATKSNMLKMSFDKECFVNDVKLRLNLVEMLFESLFFTIWWIPICDLTFVIFVCLEKKFFRISQFVQNVKFSKFNLCDSRNGKNLPMMCLTLVYRHVIQLRTTKAFRNFPFALCAINVQICEIEFGSLKRWSFNLK